MGTVDPKPGESAGQPAMIEPYTITVGYLEEEQITVVDMPRYVFVEMVERLIDSFDESKCAALRDELLPVANTMPRFPLSTWIDPNRGCGCLVGEYLVATIEMNRAELAHQLHDGETRLSHLLKDNPLARELIHIGKEIDEYIFRWLNCALYNNYYYDDDAARNVDAVVFK